MYQKRYFASKLTGTHADEFFAVGLAKVIDEIVRPNGATTTIVDAGSVYVVEVSEAIKQEWVKSTKFFAATPLLVTALWEKAPSTGKKAKKKASGEKVQDRKFLGAVAKGTSIDPASLLVDGNTIVDHEAEKAKAKAIGEFRKTLKGDKAAYQAFLRGEIGPEAPTPFYSHFIGLTTMSAADGYNGLVERWRAGRDQFEVMLNLILAMTASPTNDFEAAENEWKALAKANGWKLESGSGSLQILVPSQVKGVNGNKAVMKSASSLDAFWIIDWLRAYGYLHSCITSTFGKKKDRKAYTVIPKQMSISAFNDVMARFKKSTSFAKTKTKFDIVAGLNLVRALIDYCIEAKEVDPLFADFDPLPSDFVSGIRSMFYMNLGNGSAPMGGGVLGLPEWIGAKSVSLNEMRGVVDEHIKLITNPSFDEDHSDVCAMLADYASFTFSGDLTALYRFFGSYSHHLMSQIAVGKKPSQFTQESLEVLFMSQHKDYSKIVKSKGFQSFAKAIRLSTVVPQWQKALGKKPVVEIRYGLGQELLRAGIDDAKFLAYINEFGMSYSAENARVAERGKQSFRHSITAEDAAEMTELVCEFGAETVAGMLAGFGYYKSKRKADVEAEDADIPNADSGDESEEEGEE